MTTDPPTATIDIAYLDSLAAKAAPAWAGVDADKWLDSVRGGEASAANTDREICQGCGEYEDECDCPYRAVKHCDEGLHALHRKEKSPGGLRYEDIAQQSILRALEIIASHLAKTIKP